MLKIDVTQVAYHRNGVMGEGFYVVLFNWRDGRKVRRMMATVFGDKGCKIAVLDIDETAKGNVAFAAGNSWRGDDFEAEIRFAIQEADAAYSVTVEG